MLPSSTLTPIDSGLLLVFEAVMGGPLDDHLRKSRASLTLEACLAYVAQVLAGPVSLNCPLATPSPKVSH